MKTEVKFTSSLRIFHKIKIAAARFIKGAFLLLLKHEIEVMVMMTAVFCVSSLVFTTGELYTSCETISFSEHRRILEPIDPHGNNAGERIR
jgi:hypothetical protein